MEVSCETGNKNRMDIEKNLNRYLKTEALLNDFFNVFDYCIKKCIANEINNNPGQTAAACCKDKYHSISDLDHPVFSILRHERELRYGAPGDQVNPDPVSPCEYHGPKGCRLLTHKSPICLAFMCRKSIDFLRETYDIYTYDYLGVYYALEWILTGDLFDVSYKEFRDSIRRMTRKVKERREE